MSTFAPGPNPEDSSAEPEGAGSEHYRMFFINSADKFQGVQVYLGTSDTDALERARSALTHHPYAAAIEVWRRGVLVGRIDR
jgi:hypothetical protein